MIDVSRRRMLAANALLILLLAACGSPKEVSLTAALSGGAAVPVPAGPGDPDASGTATLTVKLEAREVCYSLRPAGTGPVLEAQIRAGEEGVEGPVVMRLTAYFGDKADGCIPAPAEADLDAIAANPRGFYLALLTSQFPGGAVRGQLDTAH